jgi:Xaa-Pro aminopeptidase
MNFIEESFHPIAGFREHGAIVHYHATEETNSYLKGDGLLLIDSGGQFLEGTTDVTRTIAIGKVSDQQKKDFTLVLKGMIQLTKAIFPFSTKGSSLDILARKYLWENYLDYGHGTGHGVGHFLGVHEAPVSIRKEISPYELREGNITSNEPGLYKEGEYGIRIENLILCIKDKNSAKNDFLCFETLTLCPIDKKLILKDLLLEKEVNWINDYHQRILNELGPDLDEATLNWLKIQCAPL